MKKASLLGLVIVIFGLGLVDQVGAEPCPAVSDEEVPAKNDGQEPVKKEPSKGQDSKAAEQKPADPSPED